MTDTCSICCEGLASDCVQTKCGHIFHQDCIAKWVVQKKNCPVCRHKLKRKTDMKPFRCNLLSHVCGAIARPNDYIDSFEGANRTRIQGAFHNLKQSWSSNPNSAPQAPAPPTATTNNVEVERLRLALMKSSEKAQDFEAQIKHLKSKVKDQTELKNTLMNAVNSLNGRLSGIKGREERAKSDIILKQNENNALRQENLHLHNSLKELSKKTREKEGELNNARGEIALFKQIQVSEKGDESEVRKLDNMIFNKDSEQALAALKPIFLHVRMENKRLKKQAQKNQQTGDQMEITLRKRNAVLRTDLATAQLELEDEKAYSKKCVKRIQSLKKKLEEERAIDNLLSQKMQKAGQQEEEKSEKVVEPDFKPTLSAPSLTSKHDFPVDFDTAPAKPQKRKSSGSSSIFANFQNAQRKVPFGANKRKNKFGGRKKKRFRL